MNELIGTVDWSRAQFALTAMYHWLFVPLTIGLALIVAIMETIYVRTGKTAWKGITRFWMTLFGINFAIGVATGLILEFEFGTNWSNYSWFVGDIFGAPLAIEGLFAFFLEATFVAVMFFGWNKVSPRFHLTATWLTALGVTLSAWWILVANAWMQYPVGMQFDPAQMRNVMDNFWQVALSSVAVNKFFHTVTETWSVAAVFVIGVSSWMLWRGRNREACLRSIKVASVVGAVGILGCMAFGHGSAVDVARHQPMKLAAMEGLNRGSIGTELVGVGFLDQKAFDEGEADAVKCKIAFPGMLSWLANGSTNTFVPGVRDIIDGVSLTPEGDTVNTISYTERMAMGREARKALEVYSNALRDGDKAVADAQLPVIEKNYKYFGYGFLNSPEDAVPPVALTFYSFHIMVILGGYLLLIFTLFVVASYMPRFVGWLRNRFVLFLGIVSVPLVWICSQAGWVTAEVGRQPWVIQDLMPTGVAISSIPTSSVVTTFVIFAVLFTALLAAEISIMCRQISKNSRTDIQEVSQH